MTSSSKLGCGVMLNVIGSITLMLGLMASFTLIGAVIGIPMVLVSVPLLIWGVYWIYKARSDRAQQVIERGIREGLAGMHVSLQNTPEPPSVEKPSLSKAPLPLSAPLLPAAIKVVPPPGAAAMPAPATQEVSTPTELEVTQMGPAQPAELRNATLDPRSGSLAAAAADWSLLFRQPGAFFSRHPVPALSGALLLMVCVAGALAVSLLSQRSKQTTPVVNQAHAAPPLEVTTTPSRRAVAVNQTSPIPFSSPSTYASVAAATAPTASARPYMAPPLTEPKSASANPGSGDNRTEALQEAEQQWKQVWVNDGETWTARAKNGPFLLQIKGRRADVSSENLTEADRLNGIEWKGRVVFTRGVERRFGLPRQQPNSSVAALTSSIALDSYGAGWNEWKTPEGNIGVYEFQKRNGRWTTVTAETKENNCGRLDCDELVRPSRTELASAGVNVPASYADSRVEATPMPSGLSATSYTTNAFTPPPAGEPETVAPIQQGTPPSSSAKQLNTDADVASLLVGTWRDENSVLTYNADGTSFGRYDDGSTSRSNWFVDGNTLKVVRVESNGRRLANPLKFRGKILQIDETSFVSKWEGSSREWHATRVASRPSPSTTLNTGPAVPGLPAAPFTNPDSSRTSVAATQSSQTSLPPQDSAPSAGVQTSAAGASATPREFPGERFTETRTRTLTPADIATWPDTKLQYAINEMFARYGAEFGNPAVKKWFGQFAWYQPRPGVEFDEIERSMSGIERENLQLLGAYRTAKREARKQQPAGRNQRKASSREDNSDYEEPNPVAQRLLESILQGVRQGLESHR